MSLISHKTSFFHYRIYFVYLLYLPVFPVSVTDKPLCLYVSTKIYRGVAL